MSKTPFLWGAATSAHQIDGNSIHNDWWEWEQQGFIEGGVKSGLATDHWRLYKTDLKLARDLGLNSYRFSFEWSRLEPTPDHWDELAFQWYENFLNECEAQGLKPMATLHHFTSPAWFAHRGGFAASSSPQRFLRYVEKILERFGNHIELWCTFNEPMVLVVGSYLGSFMPPGKYDPASAVKACQHLLEAHVLTYDAIHEKNPTARVGIAHNMLDFMPDRKWHPIERLLSSQLKRFYNAAWLNALMGKKQKFSVPFLLPAAKEISIARNRRTMDYIGLNYYTKAIVQWRPRTAAHERPSELPLGLSFARRKEVFSDVEWAIHPEGLRKILKSLKPYQLPIYITENGIADHRDRLRPGYLISHLTEIARSLSNDRLPILGYYHWSLLDNFEWIKGYGPRFGLYRVNFETQERTPTGSALILKDLIQAHHERHPNTLRPDLAILESERFRGWVNNI